MQPISQHKQIQTMAHEQPCFPSLAHGLRRPTLKRNPLFHRVTRAGSWIIQQDHVYFFISGVKKSSNSTNTGRPETRDTGVFTSEIKQVAAEPARGIA